MLDFGKRFWHTCDGLVKAEDFGFTAYPVR
jgi:hypothetical protein